MGIQVALSGFLILSIALFLSLFKPEQPDPPAIIKLVIILSAMGGFITWLAGLFLIIWY